MSGHWASSTRTMPKHWDTIRRQALNRANNQCQHTDPNTGQRCTQTATDIDHINDRNNHTPHNLQALCAPHHKQKTQHEAQQAQAATLAKLTHPTTRNTHPGYTN